MSDTVTKALIFVLALDLMLFLGQIAVNAVAVEIGKPAPFIFNPNGDLISQAGSNYTVNTTNLEDRLYSSNPVISTGSSGDWFTDTAKDITAWFIDKIPGINYLVGIVGAPASYLAVIGAPIEVTFAIGGFWLILTIFLIVSFITGRNQ
jgi:hypothetical protein